MGFQTTDLKKNKKKNNIPGAGHGERLLKLVKYRWTRLHHMLGNFEPLRRVLTVFFFVLLWEDKALFDFVFFWREGSPKRQISAEDRKYEEAEAEAEAAEEQSRATTLNSTFSTERIERNLEPFEPKTSRLSNLYTFPPLSVVTVRRIVTVLSGVDVPRFFFL